MTIKEIKDEITCNLGQVSGRVHYRFRIFKSGTVDVIVSKRDRSLNGCTESRDFLFYPIDTTEDMDLKLSKIKEYAID